MALFAALSYAITQSGRGGGGISKEKLVLEAAQIIQYVGQIDQAIKRMRLLYGCKETDISFENSIVSGYTNTNAPPDACKVFNAAGGAVQYQVPKLDWMDTTQSGQSIYRQWYFPRGMCIDHIGDATVWCGDVAASIDLVLILPYITRELCIELNNRLDFLNPGGEPPVDGVRAWPNGHPKFTGSYVTGNGLDVPDVENRGKYSGCFEGDVNPGANTYHFFHVLIGR